MNPDNASGPGLQRRLGVRDLTLIVMGGVIGSGIFMKPSAVAAAVHTPALIMLVWTLAGLIALGGTFIFAELAARRPEGGGVYAYLRDAFHPSVAFAYGWTALLVTQSGGAAASAVTFANYTFQLTGYRGSPTPLAALAIAAFTFVNCLGVRTGTTTQNAFVIFKILAIGGVVGIGLFALHATATPSVAVAPPASPLAAIGIALVGAFFAYLGWGTATYMTAEVREPERTMPRGLIAGMLGVTALYLLVNVVCIAVLTPAGLAATKTPASDIVQHVFGSAGAKLMAAVIALSTLGFISNQILTSPRVYYQMAADRTFFSQLARIDPRTHVPVVAIAVQGALAIAIAFSGSYDTITNWVTSADFIFFALCAIALFAFRRRDEAAARPAPWLRMPLHPASTAAFIVISILVVIDVFVKSPVDTLIGAVLVGSGFPVYFAFQRFRKR